MTSTHHGTCTNRSAASRTDLPAALKPLISIDHWLIWKSVKRNGKWTKPPYRAQAPELHAAADNPRTWCDYATAHRAATRLEQEGGVGFVLTDTEVQFIDLDECRNVKTGAVAEWAQDLIDQAKTYVELSPSEDGFHVIGLSKKKREKKSGQVQMPGGHIEFYYGSVRYMTVTGKEVGNCRELQDIDWLLDELAGRKKNGGAADEKKDPSSSDRQVETHSDLNNELLKVLIAAVYRIGPALVSRHRAKRALQERRRDHLQARLQGISRHQP